MSKKFITASGSAFVIAEAGVNHNGDINLAKKLIDVAVDAKADCVKFQTFIPEKVMSVYAPKAAYQEVNTGAGEYQIDMVRKLQLPFKAFEELASYCLRKNILFLSTPFDFESIQYLEKLNMPFYKVPSGEITNFPHLEAIAELGHPMLISTGMSTLDEVRAAVETVYKKGNKTIALMHCVSLYPAPVEYTNLKVMETLGNEFNVPVGLSDHTLDIEIALAAIAMGARVIEKHFTLDQSMTGPDHRASLNPHQLKDMIQKIRNIEKSFGDGIKKPHRLELDTASVARRSLVAARTIPRGTVLQREDIEIKRPGTGLMPSQLNAVLGRKTLVEIKSDSLISMEMLS